MAAISGKSAGMGAALQGLFSRIPTRLWIRGGLAGQIVESRWYRAAAFRAKKMMIACDSLAAVGLNPSDFMGRFLRICPRTGTAATARVSKLVADEPMSAVDVSGRLQIVKVFTKLRAQGYPCLMVLHDLAERSLPYCSCYAYLQGYCQALPAVLGHCSRIHGSLLLRHSGCAAPCGPCSKRVEVQGVSGCGEVQVWDNSIRHGTRHESKGCI